MYLSFPLNCISWYVFVERFLMVEPRANKEGHLGVTAELGVAR